MVGLSGRAQIHWRTHFWRFEDTGWSQGLGDGLDVAGEVFVKKKPQQSLPIDVENSRVENSTFSCFFPILISKDKSSWPYIEACLWEFQNKSREIDETMTSRLVKVEFVDIVAAWTSASRWTTRTAWGLKPSWKASVGPILQPETLLSALTGKGGLEFDSEDHYIGSLKQKWPFGL